MAIKDDITKVRELSNQLRTLAQMAEHTAETLDPIAVCHQTADALRHVVGALERFATARPAFKGPRRRCCRPLRGTKMCDPVFR